MVVVAIDAAVIGEPDRTLADVQPQVDLEWLRSAVRSIRGEDPGPLETSLALDEAGLAGLDLLVCIGLLEDAFEIDFPADLLAVLETVDDLLHFAALKQAHKTGLGNAMP